jgi:hypothetical protein
MAARSKEQKEKAALVNLTPHSITVTVDGHDVRVATNESENRIMNQVLASQVRYLLQQSIKKFNDMEAPLTPKELRDLAEAAKAAATFSAEVYSKGDGIDPGKEEKPIESDDDEPDLSNLVKPKQPEPATEVKTTES